MNLPRFFVLLSPILGLLFIFFFDLNPARPEVTRMAAVAILMAVWWITEAVPLAVTALLPVTLFPVLGIMDGKTVAGLYCNHIIFLFIGGLLVALAMERWNLHRRIALGVLLLVGAEPSRIILGFMLATAFLSMWISNTATTMMMVPIGLAVINGLEHQASAKHLRRYAVGLFLGIAYSASIGGVATLVGTPTNLSFVRIFQISFPDAPEITFTKWLTFALPVSVTILAVTWLLLTRLFCQNLKQVRLDSGLFQDEFRLLGRMSWAEKIVLADFILLICLWLFRSDIRMGGFTVPGWSNLFADLKSLNDGTVAIAVATLLFLIPAAPNSKGSERRVLDWETASKLPWHIVLLLGGGFALASGFKVSGLSEWIGNRLSNVGTWHPIVLIGTVCLLVTFLTELTSNVATVEVFLPILGALSSAINIHPIFLMVPATLSCSFAFMLPVATPPNAIIFATNRIKIWEMAKTGIWLNLLAVFLVTLATLIIGKVIFDINLSQPPNWM